MSQIDRWAFRFGVVAPTVFWLFPLFAYVVWRDRKKGWAHIKKILGE